MKRILTRVPALAILPALLSACGGGGSDSITQTAQAQAALSLAETVDNGAVYVGDRVSWTIVATNHGNGATAGTTTLLANIPGGLTNVSAMASGITCGPVVSTLTCTIPAGFVPGTTATVVISGQTTTPGTLASSVSTAAAGACASTTDCSSSTTVSARPIPPQVKVTAAVDTTATAVGTTVNWTLTATNTGGPTTAPIILTDTLPASGIGALTVTPTGAACNPVSGNTLTCTIPAGLAGTNGSATVRLSAPATAVGSLVNTVSPGAGASCNLASDCSTTTNVAAAAVPNVTVSSSVNATSGFVGDTLTWTLSATNQGNGATTAPITLTDTLPSSGIGALTVTPSGASCAAVTGNTLTCTIPAGLASGGGTATVTVRTTATSAGNLSNTLAPGAGATCASAGACSTTTAISAAAVQVAGSCGLMIDANTLNNSFGGASSTLVPVSGLGSTSSGGPNTSAYLVGLASSGDPASLESWPGTVSGPASGTMVAATGQQFICASQNGSATTGASAAVKYTSSLTSPTSGSPTSLAGNLQLSKQVGNPAFVTFNLRSLSDFSFEFFRAGSNGYQVDYTTDGTTWRNIVTTSASRSACANSVCDELSLLSTAPTGATSFTPTAPIKQPLVLRVSNINTSGTMVIQKIMIKP